MDTEVDRLSGGEQQMAAVARALSGDTRVLLVDEPFEDLAPAVVEQLFHAFDKLRDVLSSVIVDHNLDLALALSDRTVALERGRIFHKGPSKDLAQDIELRRQVLWLWFGLHDCYPKPGDHFSEILGTEERHMTKVAIIGSGLIGRAWAIFAELDRVAAPQTILASSSSTFVASRFASGLAGIARIIVAHPVNPPHLIPVVELCPAPQTDAAVVARAEQLYRQAGQVPVLLSREIDGFVLNRLQAVLLAEALTLVQQDIVSVQGLDDTMRHGLGRRWAFMGPLQTILLNAPNGIADYMARYGPPMGALADTAGRGEAFSASVADTLASAFPDPAEIPELSRWRDGELAALDQHLRNRA